jgi:medium-chain acyl-[acyl-carrier-protein] hydrolase
MDTSPYRYDTKIAYNQVDPHGNTRVIALMELLQEAAIEHCSAIGMDVFRLLEDNEGWVLRAGVLDFDLYPRYGDHLHIATWISKWTAFTGTREFRLMNADDTVIATATTLWAYVDTEKKRPTPVAKAFKDEWAFAPERAVDEPFIKRPLPIPTVHTTTLFDVRRHDIDSNKHVHDVRYLEWVLESVPEEYFENYLLARIDGSFIHEARLGDSILVQAGALDQTHLVHNVVRKDTGEVLSTGRSTWRKREE